MKNAVSTVCLASLISIGAAAQAQQPATDGRQPAAQGEKPAVMQKVTISGCLEAAPPPAAAAGAPAAAAAAKFELANSKVVSGGPVGTSGTLTATRYRLDGEDKTISPHLNHQVEITGTVTPAAAGGAAPAPLLKVESVKMISAKCS
jgi:hypothetical protein